ncbi:MAG: 3-deoxy-D-manno-octulosonic acid transferase, partial [Limnohabitans sp.]|nr:3-deoxy-D-manno-octulosonic acid transferase [Limnohabitans sp.]
YGLAIEARFGQHDPATATPPGLPVFWLHAVSLGETRAAAVLLQALRPLLPGWRMVLTHGTATGRAQGQSLLQADDVQTWQPWDTPAAVESFVRHYRPKALILLETEVWPNLVGCTRAAGVPVFLVNARLSEKSLRQAQRLTALSRRSFGALSHVWAQTESDAERLQSLGVSSLEVSGNLKFDARPDAQLLALGQRCRARGARPVVLLASSREGEEQEWLNQLNALASELPEVQWLVVPRHPQRFDDVADLIVQAGFALERRSQWGADGPSSEHAAHRTLWLGDSLGEMSLYYGLADIALLGGSFAPLGGQNLIEALACNCPVVMGPHTFNFAQAAEQAHAAGAALRVADMQAAVRTACASVTKPEAHAALIAPCARFVQAHQGAAQRMAIGLVARLSAQGASN